MTEAERIIQRLSMEVSVLASQLNEAMRMLEHVGQSACGMAFAAGMEIAELQAVIDDYESDMAAAASFVVTLPSSLSP